jgi:UDP-N-acetylglucosamine transferase subunit ALG13
MIFVTVGTHEQQFDRLVEGIDRLKSESLIPREVFIQTGYSTYKPQYCEYKAFIPFDEMNRLMSESEMVVTHGGTGSIMLVLYHRKTPIVVPRQPQFREHVDDHQVKFARTMESRQKIVAVYDIDHLGQILTNYHDVVQSFSPQTGGTGFEDRTRKISQRLDELCTRLVTKQLVTKQKKK